MREKLIEIDYETIGIMEQRQLFEFASLNKALTYEEYIQIVMVYKNVVDRLAAKLPENEEG